MAEESYSLEYTPTWVVAGVCFVIVLLSLFAERGLHKLGKFLHEKQQEGLFAALQKLKEELMLLGFISLLLTVSQAALRRICMPPHLANHMLPCKRETEESSSHQAIRSRGRLLSECTFSAHCERQGKIPLLSLEALHQLHIFIFVLAVVHVIFCVTTMVLGGERIRQWKKWEDSIKQGAGAGAGAGSGASTERVKHDHEHHHKLFLEKHAKGYWRKAAVISWLIAFFKQFHGSITKADYITLRQGFIMTHFRGRHNDYDFHKYMLRTLEFDFKKIVGISWYLWLFVVIFLLLNLEGWHTYFWLAFLPLILLLLIGAKLEHVIARLALEVAERTEDAARNPRDNEVERVKPSDKHFWFGRPEIVLQLIHFILFQNSFEIAFFFWILFTYGLHSCIMEKLGFIVTRLLMGVVVQVLCSYSTLPLYALVSQMGSHFRKGIFDPHTQSLIEKWYPHAHELAVQSHPGVEREMVVIEGSAERITELSPATSEVIV